MNFDLSSYILPTVFGICLILGYIIKNLTLIDNKYIPCIVTISGIFLSIWANSWAVTPETILTGMASGLSSTGAHQLITRLVDNFGDNDSEDDDE